MAGRTGVIAKARQDRSRVATMWQWVVQIGASVGGRRLGGDTANDRAGDLGACTDSVAPSARCAPLNGCRRSLGPA
jgi:hypothetical protein